MFPDERSIITRGSLSSRGPHSYHRNPLDEKRSISRAPDSRSDVRFIVNGRPSYLNNNNNNNINNNDIVLCPLFRCPRRCAGSWRPLQPPSTPCSTSPCGQTGDPRTALTSVGNFSVAFTRISPGPLPICPRPVAGYVRTTVEIGKERPTDVLRKTLPTIWNNIII